MDKNPKTNSTPRPDNEFWLGWLLKIANAATVTLSDAALEVYLERLTKLTFAEITQAAQRTIEEWDRPCMMPPLAFILDRTAPRETLINDSPKVFGWESAGKRVGFSQSEIAEMLEAGKKAQREHIANLEADPAWRSMAARLGAMPGLTPRVAPTEVPIDPDARRLWAHGNAVKGGWLSESTPATTREPGDEA